jgi:WD40 repeat protein
MVRGYRSGRLARRPLLTSNEAQCIEVEFGGHRASVTSLVAIPASCSVYGRPLVVSSAADNSVCVWAVDNVAQLWAYQCPSPVQAPLCWQRPKRSLQLGRDLPGASNQAFRHLVGSMGDLLFVLCGDDSVRVLSLSAKKLLLSLRGHDSAVVRVHRNAWCETADYVLTETASGHVYVWVMSDGSLERYTILYYILYYITICSCYILCVHYTIL